MSGVDTRYGFYHAWLLNGGMAPPPAWWVALFDVQQMFPLLWEVREALDDATYYGKYYNPHVPDRTEL